MEDGEKRANVCSSLGLAPTSISTTMANAEKIRQSEQIKKLRASNVRYTRNVKIEKLNNC